MIPPDPNPAGDNQSQKAADFVAQRFFGVTNEVTRRRAIRDCIFSAIVCALLVPGIFYLEFGQVGPLGWGTTIFFIAYLLLSATGLFFKDKTEYHSAVPLRGDWRDHLGSFWLVGCTFGPFFGWIITSGTFPITLGSWHWLFGLRVFLAAIVPLVLALPLTRYARGKSALIAVPLLLGVTLLPISSAMNASLDLWEGPVLRSIGPHGELKLLLQHTGKVMDAPAE